MMMDIENAKRQLQLYYGIDNPTEKQVAMFILYHIVY